MIEKLTKCLLILAVSFPAAAVSWNWVNPKPTLNTIFDLVTIPGGCSEIAVGEMGTLLLSDDHWITYSECSYPDCLEGAGFRGVCFSDPEIGYLCGSGGAVLKTYDGGESWDLIFSAGQYQLLTSVSFFDRNFGYSVGSTPDDCGRIHRTTDGGVNWDTQSFPFSINSIEILSANEAVAVCGGGLVLKTTNAGVDWFKIVTPTSSILMDVDFITISKGIAVGNHGTVIITQNGGKTWTEMNVPVGEDVFFRGIKVVDNNNAVAVGVSNFSPVIVYTTNGGISWSRASSSAPNYLTCVDFNSVNGYTAAGCWGSISSSQDNGLTWNSVYNSFNNHIREIVFADADHGFCAGLEGFVAKTDDGGNSWTCQQISTSDDLFDIAVWNSDNAIAVGSNGYAAYTSNGGESWNDAVTPVSFNDLNAVAYVESGKAIAVGDEGTILISNDNGASWHFPGGYSVLIDNFEDICFADSSNGYICGEGKTFLKTTNGGERWAFMPRHGAAGVTMLSIDCLDCHTIYCAGVGHSIIRSADGGVSWELLLSGAPGSWLSIDAANTSDIVVSGDRGAAGYSNDGGATWFDAQIPTLAYLFSVFFSTDNSTFFIAGHVGAILSSTDVFSSSDRELWADNDPGTAPSNALISAAVSRNGGAVILINTTDAMNARIGIVDLSGRMIADLGHRIIPSGESSILWDSGNVPAGVYLVFMETDGSLSSSKMVVY